jgi:hypothetical protein
VIVVAVRWYLRFGLSYRDVEELLASAHRAVKPPALSPPITSRRLNNTGDDVGYVG